MAAREESPAGQWIKGGCPHDCPDACAIETRVVDGKAVEIRGSKAHATTDGTLCTKVAFYLERTYHPTRLTTPLKRAGPKGSGQFKPVSWDEALSDIAANLKRVIANDGAEAILPYSYAGNMGLLQNASLDRRFFHTIGASQLDRTICSSAGFAGLQYTLGAAQGMRMEFFEESELILLWGTNPITSSVHIWSRMQEAKRRGARLVAIDPYRSLSAEKCHDWLAIKPGTDAALALGMMHVLVTEDLLDHDYIERYTLGFDHLKARALVWTPRRAAEVTGLRAEQISELARAFGRTKKAAIRLNYGMQRHFGGGMAVRTVLCLPALTGAWRERAGGAMLSSSEFYPIAKAQLQRPDLMPKNSEGHLPRVINMSQLGDALTRLNDPPVKALLVYNSNPAVVAPDSNAVLKGLAREDLFTVVHDSFMTDTARYADIVLPATTQLENTDIHRSYGHTSIVYNHPAIAPVGESVSNTEMFRRLAQAMGLTEPSLFDTDETLTQQSFDWADPKLAKTTLGDIRATGFAQMNIPDAPFAQGGFLTPSGRCEFYSERLKAMGLDPVPTYLPPIESSEASPEVAIRYPLALNTPPQRNFMNSTFANLERFTTPLGEPSVILHPTDARSRNIRAGERVEVFNDRGCIALRAEVSEDTREGVATALSMWWRGDHESNQGINDLTGQAVTDIGGGATFYDCLVEIRKSVPSARND